MAGLAELIKLVKQFPLLYDPADDNYTDEAKRDEAWTKIAMLKNSTSTEVKRQWKIMEDSFRQCKTMDATKSWMCYDEMVFLDDYLPKAPKIEPNSDLVETNQDQPLIVRTSIVPGMGPSVQSRSVPNANLNHTENHSPEPAYQPADNGSNHCDQDAITEEVGNRSMIQDKVQSPSFSQKLPRECAVKQQAPEQLPTVTDGTASQNLRARNKTPSRLSQPSTQGRPGLRQPYGVTVPKNSKRPIRAATVGPPKKLDPIQLLFSSYTEQFKQFNRRLQGRLSVQIAQLFAAADNEQAQYEECLGVIQSAADIKNQKK
ncbi:uncharacterized protein LOC126580982 [Anopheles aquasalis]|uniref:uncharacterized protein LOC126580982 n=1 Tax=Anopheles aquasalis TaxID=42839 RepID=UPI00215AA7FC|nr:uncharacterized protein LOC126580982 [Anopheles aquasalis]